MIKKGLLCSQSKADLEFWVYDSDFVKHLKFKLLNQVVRLDDTDLFFYKRMVFIF